MGSCCSIVESDEIIIADRCTNRWIVAGPKVACTCCATVNERRKKIALRADQYLRVLHPVSRDEDVVEHISGPLIYTPNDPFCKIEGPKQKIELTINEYVIAEDGLTKEKRTIVGPALVTPGPYETFEVAKPKISLSLTQYVYLKDTLTGQYKIEVGAKTFCPTPAQEVGKVQELTVLQLNQYAKVLNKQTSEQRIVKGPITLMLNPFEDFIKENGKHIQDAYIVDAENAVLIQDITTGQQTLLREPQRFIPPSVNIVVLEKREIIKLAPYECVAVQNREGLIHFMTGTTTQAFFLEPFCKVKQQTWTSDPITGQKEKIWKFDTRPRNVKFLLKAQSSENMPFTLSMTVLWQILDLSRLFASPDPVLDLINHIRSQILSVVSKMTTQELISHSTSELVALINAEDPDYYTALGIRLLRVDVTEKKCDNQNVEHEYFSLIQKKIENDTRILDLQNQISIEKERKYLLEAEMENVSLKTKTEGQSEGGKICEFFEGLGVLPLETKIEIYRQEQRTRRIEMITGKVDHLTISPDGADIVLVEGIDKSQVNITR